MPELGTWPAWATTLAWTAATVVASWVIGRGLATLLGARTRRAAAGQPPGASPPARSATPSLVETGVQVVRGRLPWWSVLVGLWVASGYWPMTAEGRLLIWRAIFVAGAASVTLAAATIASRAVDVFATLMAPEVRVSSLTRHTAWGLVAGVGALVILNGLGVSIAPMLAALGVGGIAVALALQEPLANFFAGIFITLAGQIRVGDYVRLDSGDEGYVVDFSWRSTRLRMLSNNLVIVPNARLAQAIVVNHHLPAEDLSVLVEVGVDYASDLAHVERVVGEVGREVMTEVPGAVAGFQPFIRYHTFADSSIDFSVILRAKEFVDQFVIKHEFVKRLHARFEREGIVIPFPIRTLERREAAGPGGGAAAA